MTELHWTLQDFCARKEPAATEVSLISFSCCLVVWPDLPFGVCATDKGSQVLRVSQATPACDRLEIGEMRGILDNPPPSLDLQEN